MLGILTWYVASHVEACVCIGLPQAPPALLEEAARGRDGDHLRAEAQGADLQPVPPTALRYTGYGFQLLTLARSRRRGPRRARAGPAWPSSPRARSAPSGRSARRGPSSSGAPVVEQGVVVCHSSAGQGRCPALVLSLGRCARRARLTAFAACRLQVEGPGRRRGERAGRAAAGRGARGRLRRGNFVILTPNYLLY